MMRTLSNKLSMGLRYAALAVAFMLLAPQSASAFSLPSIPSFFSSQRNDAVSLTGVCLRIGILEGTLPQRIKAASAHYDKKADERLSRAARKLSAGVNSQAVRAETDAKLASYFKRLEAKANTAAKKQAVADFKVRVVQASDRRRDQIDAATKAYADGVAALYRGRAEQVRKLAENMRAELTAVLANADSRCRSAADAILVRSELEAGLTSVERAYAVRFADRQDLEAGLSALSEVRARAIGEANAAFSTELDASSHMLSTVLQ